MTAYSQRAVDVKLAISDDYTLTGNRVRGEKKQRDRVWERFETAEGNYYCSVCDEQIACGHPERFSDLKIGEWHHLVKRQYFPVPSEINEGEYSVRDRRSQHHISNCVILCKKCHSQLEGLEKGRPHLMSWLCKDLTGLEVPLVLPADSQRREGQWRDWVSLQREMEYAHEYRCSACGHTQQANRRLTIELEDGSSFEYTGRDVRAVHVLPPFSAPELIHHPLNIELLCIQCLLGLNGQHRGNTYRRGWIDEAPREWAETFSPPLRDLSSSMEDSLRGKT